MPLPRNRSRKYRVRVRKNVRGSRTVYKLTREFRASCAICKKNLAGIGTGSHTQKSVSRAFGGNLCHSCSERVIIDVVRVREKIKNLEDVDLSRRAYVQKLLKQ
ncbi:MAG: 50S ribosomal protein L34e [Candidatus ainarchaeum sp.]|nr:50S ribosomal protein L34e [Candidatus ainarchaeum sp.]